MKITCEQLNPHACLTYMIGLEQGSEVALIDPVLEHAQDYLHLLDERNLELTHVIDTHTHADHISGAAALKDMTDCEYVMHRNAPARCPGIRVEEGDDLRILDHLSCKVIETPGHTIDSISLIFTDRIFTGDALFLDEGGAGRDDLPGGDPGAHWETLEKFRRLPEHLVVFPAHDYRDRNPSSLRVQKKTNPHLKERSKKDFIRYLEDLRLGPADWMKDVLKANYACAMDPGAAWIPVDAPACEVKGTLETGVNDIVVSTVTKDLLKDKMGEGDPPVLLDVREVEELTDELGHIEGIVHIPIGELSQRISELSKYKDSEIVTVCRSGARAHTAAQILTQAGYPFVRVLEGGMMGWRQ